MSARYHAPDAAPRGVVILAPGAGATMEQPFLRRLCADLAGAGFGGLRFNFPYKERGAARPDPPRVLEATWRAVAGMARREFEPSFLAIGGRSMGGRIASMVVAAGEPVSALLLLAYPLHSPSGKGADRTAHLPAIRVPALFLSGTRDTLAPIGELRAAVGLVPRATLVELPGADHGFATVKGASLSTAETDRLARAAVLDWLEATAGPEA